MKVVHFSNSDLGGGAAKLAYSNHRALIEAGVSSRMLVLDRQSGDSTVLRACGPSRLDKLRFHAGRLGALALDLACDRHYNFSLDCLGAARSAWKDVVTEADIVHLHFTSRLLSMGQIGWIARTLGKPMVISAMDFAMFTGGCHYPGECGQGRARCGPCPVLGEGLVKKQLARWGWTRRRRALDGVAATVITPSSWGAERIAGLALARGMNVEVLPQAIDGRMYRPIPRTAGRAVFDIPDGDLTLLCLANDFNDRRKGLDIALDALAELWRLTGGTGLANGRRIRLLTAGSVDFAARKSLPWTHTHLGPIRDERLLALAYQTADLLLSTSREDTGPLTVVEAMMCGTPVAATECGHAPDLIESGVSGWLAPVERPDLLGARLFEALCSAELAETGDRARRRAEASHGYAAVASRLSAIYHALLASSGVQNPRQTRFS